MEPDETELEILKTVVQSPDGIRKRDCYRALVRNPHSERFLWERVNLLIAEKYLARKEIAPGRVRIFPTKKAAKCVGRA